MRTSNEFTRELLFKKKVKMTILMIYCKLIGHKTLAGSTSNGKSQAKPRKPTLHLLKMDRNKTSLSCQSSLFFLYSFWLWARDVVYGSEICYLWFSMNSTLSHHLHGRVVCKHAPFFILSLLCINIPHTAPEQ